MINLILSFNLLTSFQPLAQRQNFFQPGNDAFLLGKGREGNWQTAYISNINMLNSDTFVILCKVFYCMVAH